MQLSSNRSIVILSSSVDLHFSHTNETAIASRFYGQRLAGFIQKPYTLSALKEHLRAALSDADPVTLDEN